MDQIDLIRHFYNVEQGRRVMESTFGKVAHDPVATVLLQDKMAKVRIADPDLMKIALRMSGDENEVLSIYESLGGSFKKEALGAPMFQSPPSMPKTPGMPAPKVPQAPQPGAMGPRQLQPGPKIPQAPQPQQQPGDGQQQVKVKLEPQSPGSPGTSVSIG